MQEFKCQECEEQQEQLITNKEKKAEEKCSKCGADSNKLLPIIGNPLHARHVSWSKWSV
jgi:translation initiation factor 2 beta subunit (eIF-2beta)/eIF-5